MTPEEKQSSAERAAEEYAQRDPWKVVQNERRAGFLAGAQWEASQVAEAVRKLEEALEIYDSLDRALEHELLPKLKAALALLKEGTK